MSVELLVLAFEKAKKEIGSGKKTHLAQHLSDLLQENYNYMIHERTLRDYFTKYKTNNMSMQCDLKPKLIACFCNYLGYEDFADYVKQKQDYSIVGSKEEKEIGSEFKKELQEEKRRIENKKKRNERIFYVSVSVAFGAVFIVAPKLYSRLFKAKPGP